MPAREPQLPSEVIIRHLPELDGSTVWSTLTRSERDNWHLALGTSAVWFADEIRSKRAPSDLIARFASLLEEVANTDDPEVVNAVVVSSLEALDSEVQAIADLPGSLGPRASELYRKWITP